MNNNAYLIATIISVTIAFLLGRNTQPVRSDENSSKQVAVLEAEVLRCINNQVKELSTEQLSYSFDQLGLYSEELTDKTFTRKKYEYNRNSVQVTSTIIDNRITVDVWQPIEMFEPTSEMFFLTGYEHFNHPTKLTELQSSWNSADTFTNKSGIRYYFSYENPPKGLLYAVSAFGELESSALGQPLYIKITYPLNEVITADRNDKRMVPIKDRIKGLADSINHRSTPQ